jgi:hypothetical protein
MKEETIDLSQISPLDILKLYFAAFSKKRLVTIKEIISQDIYLKDWEVEVEGIEDYLDFHETFFNSVGEISIEGYTIFEGNPYAPTEGIEEGLKWFFCPLKISIDDKVLEVLDLICFNEENKICAVMAYRQ